MSSAGWPGSIGDDQSVCVRGDHPGNTNLHGDRILLYVVAGRYAITTGAPS